MIFQPGDLIVPKLSFFEEKYRTSSMIGKIIIIDSRFFYPILVIFPKSYSFNLDDFWEIMRQVPTSIRKQHSLYCFSEDEISLK